MSDIETVTNERDHFKGMAEEYAERILQQSAIIADLRTVVRHARNIVDTAKAVSPFDTLTKPVAGIEESFLEDLRSALASIPEGP